MSAWLYQMKTGEVEGEPWSPQEYRLQVWEGYDTTWNARKIHDRNKGTITPGDLIVFVFTKSRTKDHGIYGWGIIEKYNARTNRLTFTPTFPSDYLKTSPVWDDSVAALLDQVRVPAPYTGTMWFLTLGELQAIRAAIKRHLGEAKR